VRKELLESSRQPEEVNEVYKKIGESGGGEFWEACFSSMRAACEFRKESVVPPESGGSGIVRHLSRSSDNCRLTPCELKRFECRWHGGNGVSDFAVWNEHACYSSEKTDFLRANRGAQRKPKAVAGPWDWRREQSIPIIVPCIA